MDEVLLLLGVAHFLRLMGCHIMLNLSFWLGERAVHSKYEHTEATPCVITALRHLILDEKKPQSVNCKTC